jgi:GPH family glycoside/pentoside/hexuronide:cation symporter
MMALSAVRIALTTGSAALPFFVVHFLGQDEGDVSIYVAALLAAVLIAVPLWKFASVRWDKPPVYQASLLLTAAAFGSVFFLDSANTSGAIAAVFVIGLGTASHWILPWSMLPDTIDGAADRLPVGLPFGVYGTAEKLARTMALVAVPAVLGMTGYDAGAEIAGDTSVLAIRVLAGPIPALFLLAAAVTLRRFGLTRST